jgi:hypothetical protein
MPVGGVYRWRKSPRSRRSDLAALLFALLAVVLSGREPDAAWGIES